MATAALRTDQQERTHHHTLQVFPPVLKGGEVGEEVSLSFLLPFHMLCLTLAVGVGEQNLACWVVSQFREARVRLPRGRPLGNWLHTAGYDNKCNGDRLCVIKRGRPA